MFDSREKRIAEAKARNVESLIIIDNIVISPGERGKKGRKRVSKSDDGVK